MAARVVVTQKFRCSFLKVFKAEYNELSKVNEFSVSAIFQKSTGGITPIKKAWDEVIEEEFGNNPVVLEDLRPFFSKHKKDMGAVQDGDKKVARATEDKQEFMDEVYSDTYVMNLKAKEESPPDVVDQNKEPILNVADFKSGDYARAVIEISAFRGKSGPAISVKLKTLQKLADGPAIGGGISTAAATAMLDTVETEIQEDDIL